MIKAFMCKMAFTCPY